MRGRKGLCEEVTIWAKARKRKRLGEVGNEHRALLAFGSAGTMAQVGRAWCLFWWHQDLATRLWTCSGRGWSGRFPGVYGTSGGGWAKRGMGLGHPGCAGENGLSGQEETIETCPGAIWAVLVTDGQWLWWWREGVYLRHNLEVVLIELGDWGESRVRGGGDKAGFWVSGACSCVDEK